MGVIKLTFYCGKLWHSDKPFTIQPKHVALGMYHEEILAWLSTAYEVQNPEEVVVISEQGGYWAHKEGNKYHKLEDGDQITLPEGYEIKTHLQWHPVGCGGKWQNTNEYYWNTVQFPCGKRRAATITIPEKAVPESSFRGCTVPTPEEMNPKVESSYVPAQKEHDTTREDGDLMGTQPFIITIPEQEYQVPRIVQKDAEIESLRQQLQEKDRELSELKAREKERAIDFVKYMDNATCEESMEDHYDEWYSRLNK